jgi:hypothetical protein
VVLDGVGGGGFGGFVGDFLDFLFWGLTWGSGSGNIGV